MDVSGFLRGARRNRDARHQVSAGYLSGVGRTVPMIGYRYFSLRLGSVLSWWEPSTFYERLLPSRNIVWPTQVRQYGSLRLRSISESQERTVREYGLLGVTRRLRGALLTCETPRVLSGLG